MALATLALEVVKITLSAQERDGKHYLPGAAERVVANVDLSLPQEQLIHVLESRLYAEEERAKPQ